MDSAEASWEGLWERLWEGSGRVPGGLWEGSGRALGELWEGSGIQAAPGVNYQTAKNPQGQKRTNAV